MEVNPPINSSSPHGYSLVLTGTALGGVRRPDGAGRAGVARVSSLLAD